MKSTDLEQRPTSSDENPTKRQDLKPHKDPFAKIQSGGHTTANPQSKSQDHTKSIEKLEKEAQKQYLKLQRSELQGFALANVMQKEHYSSER